MSPDNEKKFTGLVHNAAYQALKQKNFVSPIDVLLGIGWLKQDDLDRWRKGTIPYLEGCVSANLKRISAAMKIFRAWTRKNNLKPSRTEYIAKSSRQHLQFSKSGNPTIENLYRTHYVAPLLTEKKATSKLA